MVKLALIGAVALIGADAWAMGESDTPEEIINEKMCRQHDHHYDMATQECVYCAHHLDYDAKKKTCEGHLSPLGKCYGDDHFHAATLECMYCAVGHEFNEDTRNCEEVKEAE